MMSEAWWQVQTARTAGYYIGRESLDMALTKTQLAEHLQITIAEINGEQEGEESMNNEQNDNVSEDSEDSIMHKANRAWVKWATDNNITATNTSPETYKLMAEAFVDGYTNGFVKRFTEGE